MTKKFLKIKQYLLTMLVSMSVVFVAALALEVDLVCSMKDKMDIALINTKSLSEFYTIDELEKKIKEDKDDYISYIKLAKKYNDLEEYNKANLNYQLALQISDRSNYSLYSYALFCIERKLYNTALNLAEELNLADKKAMKYKAVLYEKIADYLDKDGEIEGSIKAYQVAHKYKKGLYPLSKREDLETKYALEYLKAADIKIKERKMADAVLDLKNSLKIKETPLANYKLAFIYKDSNPIEAEKIMAKILETNPYVVNPFIYNEILTNLTEQARAQGNNGRVNYYHSKSKNFNKLLNSLYVFKDDIKFNEVSIIDSKNVIFGTSEKYLNIKIKNNTKYEIDNMYILVEIYYQNRKYEIKKKAITKTNILSAQSNSKSVTIKLPDEILQKSDLPKTNDVIVKLYAKKRNKAPWTLIKIQHFK